MNNKCLIPIEMSLLTTSIDEQYYLKSNNGDRVEFKISTAMDNLAELASHECMEDPSVDIQVKVGYLTKAIDCFANHLNLEYNFIDDYAFGLTLRDIKTTIPIEVFNLYLNKLMTRNTYQYNKYLAIKENIEKNYRRGSLITYMISSGKDRTNSIPTFIITDKRNSYTINDKQRESLIQAFIILMLNFKYTYNTNDKNELQYVTFDGRGLSSVDYGIVFEWFKDLYGYNLLERFRNDPIEVIQVKEDHGSLVIRYYNDTNTNILTTEIDSHGKVVMDILTDRLLGGYDY